MKNKLLFGRLNVQRSETEQQNKTARQAHAKLLIEALARLTGARNHRSWTFAKHQRDLYGFDTEKILDCKIFDIEFYKKSYPDIVGDERYALRHFALHGQFEGRRPSIYFDTKYYRQERLKSSNNSAVARGASDFLHYIEFGWKEGLDPSALFSTTWYLRANPDVHALGICPLYHFATRGLGEARAPSGHIDVPWYAKLYLPEEANLTLIYEDMVRTYPNRALSAQDYVTRCVPQFAASRGDVFRIDFNGRDLFSGPRDLSPPMPSTLQRTEFPDTKSIDVLTVDIWDTLLRRNCHPDEIKLQTARYLYMTERHRLKPFFQDPLRLLVGRLQSEAAVATTDDKEYQLEDVLRYWFLLAFSGRLENTEVDRLIGKLVGHELSAEKRATRVDQNVERFIKSQHVPVFFASDFYGRQHFVNALLDHHDVSHMFVGGYVSCDHFKTKRTGRLFEKIREDLNIDVKKWLHVGDNRVSDFASPASQGIQAFLYENAEEERRSKWYSQAFGEYRRGNTGAHERRLLSIIEEFANACASSESAESHLIKTGAQISIISFAFILSVIEDAVANNLQTIHFFTREGTFFKKMAEVITKCDPYNVGYPDLSVLEVSRLATFAPSLTGADNASFMRMWRLYSSQSLQEFCMSLGLDCQTIKPIGERHRIVLDKKILYPWKDKKFQSFIKDKNFIEIFEHHTREQKAGLREYLRSKKFGSTPSNVEMVVDIGWRGTIQDNLAAFTSVPMRGHYLGLMRFLNPQPKNSYKTGFLFNENDDKNRFRAPSEIAPLEMIYNSLGGSVVGYSFLGEGPVAQRLAEAGEDRVIADTVVPLQDGMLRCAEVISDYVRRHGLSSKDLLRLAQQATQSLCERPPFAIADAFFDLRHNESFGAGQIEHLGAKLDGLHQVSANLKPSGPELHRVVSDLVSASRWREGLFSSAKLRSILDDLPDDVQMSLPTKLFVARAPHLIKMRGQSVSIYCPSPIAGSGGHRTIFNVGRALAQFGLHLQCFVDGVGDGLELIEEWLAGSPAQIHAQWHAHIKADFALATVANSAKYVAELPHARTRGYLVQDLESLFNPVSDNFLVAENSYRYGLRHYTIGNWLCHLIPKQYGAQAVAAGLGVDNSVYGIDASVRRELAVCCLFQPDKFRRLPNTALEALKLVSERLPGVKIYLYGSDIVINPTFRVEQLGLIKNLSELNKLYNQCTVGLCLSMSNPSRIPFEMMASGCIPVDLYRHNNLFDYGNDATILAYQSAESIADAIVTLLTYEHDHIAALREKARQFAAGRSLDWEVDTIVNNIIAQMEGREFVQHNPSIMYTNPPHLAPIDDVEPTRWFCSRQSSETVSSQDPDLTEKSQDSFDDVPLMKRA